MRAIIATSIFVCFSSGQAGTPDYLALWRKFKVDFEKKYDTHGDEESRRFEVFKANIDLIEETNAKKLSYKLGINQFADLTQQEFAAQYLGYRPELRLAGLESGALAPQPFPNITGLTVPDSVNWVEKGAVTKVKNQASCGSCWAFSSTGALEGAFFLSEKKLLSFSEEDLVQCDKTDDGCNGGEMDHAFTWVEKNGICTESSYPYTSGSGITGTCKHSCTPVAKASGFVDVPPRNQNALMAAVAKQPVSIAIEADHACFQLYSEGVLSNPACGTKLDHGVLVVGYGTDSGEDYWLVKNSWGSTWGEEGYIRMKRSTSGAGECGLAMQPSYPTGVTAMGPVPPGPSPGPSPPSGQTHYGNPSTGCEDDEQSVRIQGVEGEICAPSCLTSACPTDVPAGTTVQPQCALQNPSGSEKLCALICDPTNVFDSQCGPATCQADSQQPSVGICTYSDSHVSEAEVQASLIPEQAVVESEPESPTTASAQTHYGDPSTGCESDEQAVRIQGVKGDVCAPSCLTSACPTDVPEGTTVKPQCALQNPSGSEKLCALICDPSNLFDSQCGPATCQADSQQPSVGLCTYSDAEDSSATEVSLIPEQTVVESEPESPPATASAQTHYGDPSTGCENDEQAVRIQGVKGDVCAPSCLTSACPTDVPEGTTVKPQCALQNPSGSEKLCALICDPSNLFDSQCGPATCQADSQQPSVGLCTYSDAEDSSATEVSLIPQQSVEAPESESPTASAQTHYGDPSTGCESDEQAVRIQGVKGDVCAPSCLTSACPTDVPEGTTVKPQCALQNPSGSEKLCALICDPSNLFDSQCGPATCQADSQQPSVGLCTYSDTTDSSATEVSLIPEQAATESEPEPPTTASAQTHFGDPSAGCESDEQAVRIQGVKGEVCAPSCLTSACPTDVPEGTTVKPQCALQNPSGSEKLCALICDPSNLFDSQCGPATCQADSQQPSVGLCTYSDTKDLPVIEVSLSPKQAVDLVI